MSDTTCASCKHVQRLPLHTQAGACWSRGTSTTASGERGAATAPAAACSPMATSESPAAPSCGTHAAVHVTGNRSEGLAHRLPIDPLLSELLCGKTPSDPPQVPWRMGGWCALCGGRLRVCQWRHLPRWDGVSAPHEQLSAYQIISHVAPIGWQPAHADDKRSLLDRLSYSVPAAPGRRLAARQAARPRPLQVCRRHQVCGPVGGRRLGAVGG